MPKRYKHLFEQVVSLQNLFAAARKAMRGRGIQDHFLAGRDFSNDRRIGYGLEAQQDFLRGVGGAD
jgi:hypothetical protein